MEERDGLLRSPYRTLPGGRSDGRLRAGAAVRTWSLKAACPNRVRCFKGTRLGGSGVRQPWLIGTELNSLKRCIVNVRAASYLFLTFARRLTHLADLIITLLTSARRLITARTGLILWVFTRACDLHCFTLFYTVLQTRA